MVFPIGDDNSDRVTFPFVTIALIVANVFVFAVLQQGFRPAGIDESFTMAYVQVPAEIISGQDIETEPQMRVVNTPQGPVEVADPGLRKTPIPVWLTLLTAIFMHGSVMHLLGNMWFLWIFGDNIEDDMGHASYLLFYLACGVLASLAFVALNATGEAALTPCLGASGAISGVLGGYLVLHPNRRVSVIAVRMMIDVPGYVERKLAGMLAHRTQCGAQSPKATIPAAALAPVLGREWFVRIHPAPTGALRDEDDLLAGLHGGPA
jgi:membrane associated rhomboid family serine protease